MSNKLGEMLRACRKKLGKTESEIATLCNLNRSTINYYECGKQFPKPHIVPVLVEKYSMNRLPFTHLYCKEAIARYKTNNRLLDFLLCVRAYTGWTTVDVEKLLGNYVATIKDRHWINKHLLEKMNKLFGIDVCVLCDMWLNRDSLCDEDIIINALDAVDYYRSCVRK